MFYRILTFAFLNLFSIAFTNDSGGPDTILSSLEGHIDMITPYHVNVANGDFVLHEVDAVIPGAEPLSVYRCYDSMAQGTAQPFGDWFMHRECYMFLQDKSDRNYPYKGTFYIPEFSGAIVRYKRRKGGLGIVKGKDFKFLSNNTTGVFSAQTNLKNNKVYSGGNVYKFDVNYLVIGCDGTKRYYAKSWKKNGIPIALRKVVFPNGNSLEYEYEKHWFPSKITTYNRLQEPQSWIRFHYKDKGAGYFVELSDGRVVDYTNMVESLKKNPKHVLHKVKNSSKPDITYHYLFGGKNEQGLREKLCRVEYPDQRYLLNVYYNEQETGKNDFRIGRIKEQMAPVGDSSDPVIVARYQYRQLPENNFETTVYDALGAKKVYTLCGNRRIRSIAHYDFQGNLHHIERMVWGTGSEEGNLQAKIILSPENEVLVAKHWIFDSEGNVLEERLIGNITGQHSQSIRLDEKGLPIPDSADCSRLFHTYTKDDFHLLLSTTDNRGTKTEWTYYEKSNLTKSRIKYGPNQKYANREFFEYDNSALVSCHITDDGLGKERDDLTGVTQRSITYMRYHQCGKVEEQKECAFDLSEHVQKQINRTLTTYNKYGNPTCEQLFDANDQLCMTIRRSFDLQGHVIEEIDPMGRITKNEYDANGNLICCVGPDPAISYRMTYDFSNRMTKKEEIHSDGTTLTSHLKYNLLGQCISTIDPWGAKTEREYDFAGRLIKETMPTHLSLDNQQQTPQIKRTYHTLGCVSSVIDPNGYQTSSTYTILGKPIEITLANQTHQSYTYDLDGSPLTQIGPDGITTTFEYDAWGRVIRQEQVDPSGKILGITTAQYNAFQLISTCDAAGLTTFYEYDFQGRLKQQKCEDQVVEYEYDSLGRQRSTRRYLNESDYISTISEKDVFNRLTEERIEDSRGVISNRTCFSYDLAGNCIQTVVDLDIEQKATTQCHYNSRKELISTTDALGHTTAFEYNQIDGLSGLLYEEKTIDPLGNQTITHLNAYKKPQHIEKRSAQGVILSVSELRYDNALKVVSQVEQIYHEGEFLRSFELRFVYGPSGRIEKEILAFGTPDEKIVNYHYDEQGRLKEKIKSDGVSLFYEYNSKGLLERLSSAGNEITASIDYSYSYDIANRLVSANDHIADSQTVRSYDILGRLLYEKQMSGQVVNYTYDCLGRKTTTSLSDGSRAEYHYDLMPLRKIDRFDRNGTKNSTTKFEERTLTGRPKLVTTPIGTIRYRYDDMGRLANIESPYFKQENLQYDPCGNLTSFVWSDHLNRADCSFKYDDLYQLISEDGLATHNFKCDSLSNRLEADEAIYEVNDLNQYLSQGAEDYSYDKAGNLIAMQRGDQKVLFKYDALDRLIEVEEVGHLKLVFTYDSFHRRISKRMLVFEQSSWKPISTLYFLYEGQKEIGAVDKTGCIVELRVLQPLKDAEMGAAVTIELDGKSFTPFHDHRGSVVALVDEKGTLSEYYRYSSFGQEEIYNIKGKLKESALLNPWRFCSKRTDDETGFVYFGRRYYHPTLGRWLTPDPDGFQDGPNLYAYVHNRPQILFDAFGLFSLPEFNTDTYSFHSKGVCNYRANWDLKTGKASMTAYKEESFKKSGPYQKYSAFTTREVELFTIETQIQKTQWHNVFRVGTHPPPNNFTISFVHGIWNSFNDTLASAIRISHTLNDSYVYVVAHPESFFKDLKDYRALRKHTDKKLTTMARDIFSYFIKEGYEHIVYAHSRGTLVAFEAVKDMNIRTPSYKDHLHMVGLGGAVYFESTLAKSIMNYIHNQDLIPLFCNLKYTRKAQLGLPCKYDIRIVEGKTESMGNPLVFHAIDNPDYQDAIRQSYNEILITKGK